MIELLFVRLLVLRRVVRFLLFNYAAAAGYAVHADVAAAPAALLLLLLHLLLRFLFVRPLFVLIIADAGAVPVGGGGAAAPASRGASGVAVLFEHEAPRRGGLAKVALGM